MRGAMKLKGADNESAIYIHSVEGDSKADGIECANNS